MIKLQGIYAPIATPFTHTGDLYKSKVQHNIEKLNAVNLSGYVVCGSTGESVMLTAEEKVQLFEWVANHAKSGKQLLCGTGVESVRETVQLTNQAAGLGYIAAVVRTPHYYKNLVATADAQVRYFRAVADQTKIPVIIDNWPQATGVDIAAEAVAMLSEHPNIVAIKESSGNLEKVMRMVREGKTGFQVLSGSAPTLYPCLKVGASGAVLAFANAAPYACVTIWEAFRTREEEAGMDWQSRIAHPASLVTVKYGIPGLKYAMDLNGFYGGVPRLPLIPVAPEVRLELEAAFDGIKG
ncbi:MAG TPA: dihydrodipicolinate synthase family protein [Bryobacteraceae bacterium]|nr:dihydrodipicolinate synthase family protein [Bryobacteraceae bacterium]